MTSTELAVVDRRSSFDLLPDAMQLAKAVAGTDFVPRAFRGKPEAVLACVLAGNELGIGPMQSLQKIHVIEGRPALSAEMMRALILGAGHDLYVEESTVTRCTVGANRNGHATLVTWTLDDAKRAGIGGKDVWRKYPRAMLLARATGEIARAVFPDVVAGFGYTLEELEDGFDTTEEGPGEATTSDKPAPPTENTRKAAGATARPRKAAAKRADRAKAQGPATPAPPLPPLPDEVDEDEAHRAMVADGTADDEIVDAEIVDDGDPGPTEPPTPIDPAQRIAIKAREAGVDHHDVVSFVTGGTSRSAKGLEAGQTADVLETIRLIKIGEARLVVDPDAGDDWTGIALTFGPFDDDAPAEANPSDPAGPYDAASSWTVGGWREWLTEHGLTVVACLKRARKVAAAEGLDVPASIDDLVDRGDALGPMVARSLAEGDA